MIVVLFLEDFVLLKAGASVRRIFWEKDHLGDSFGNVGNGCKVDLK